MASKLIGISGGIGTDKSYVSQLFKTIHHINVYDVDYNVKNKIVHDTQIKYKIVKNFGYRMFTQDNVYNVDLIRKIMFDGDNYKRLCNILMMALMDDIDAWSESIKAPYVLVTCSDMFEIEHLQYAFDEAILVTSPINLRVQRLLSNGASFDHIQNRIKSQLSDEKKSKLADHVIINDNNDEKLCEQIRNVHNDIIYHEYLTSWD